MRGTGAPARSNTRLTPCYVSCDALPSATCPDGPPYGRSLGVASSLCSMRLALHLARRCIQRLPRLTAVTPVTLGPAGIFLHCHAILPRTTSLPRYLSSVISPSLSLLRYLSPLPGLPHLTTPAGHRRPETKKRPRRSELTPDSVPRPPAMAGGAVQRGLMRRFLTSGARR